MPQQKFDEIRTQWSRRLEDLRAQRVEIDRELTDLEQRLAALDVVSAPMPGSDIPKVDSLQAERVGRAVLDWAAAYLQEHGPVKVRDLFEQLPRDLKAKFGAGSASQPPVFRFRRLFRRSAKRFSVRRSDGLIELVAPAAGPEQGHLVTAVAQFANAPQAFAVQTGAATHVMRFEEVRNMMAAGEEFFVPSTDGAGYSRLLPRGVTFRSLGADGSLNDDVALLPIFDTESGVLK